MVPLDLNVPKVWLDGNIVVEVLNEPIDQTIDHLQAAKLGPASYAGDYNAVWSGCVSRLNNGGPCRPPAGDVDAVLADPHAQLSLTFLEARYRPAERTTEVLLRLQLTYGVSRWKGNPLIRLAAERAANVLCKEDRAGCRVTWEDRERSFNGVITHLGFTLEPDNSKMRRPFVYLRWDCDTTTALVLFKKRECDEFAQLTSNERARLGIGMSSEEMEVASVLAALQTKWVQWESSSSASSTLGSAEGS